MGREEVQLEDLEKRIEQMRARKQELQQKIRAKERKERTRRLIEIGAIFEKYFEITSVEEAENIAKQFSEFVKSKKQVSSTAHPSQENN